MEEKERRAAAASEGEDLDVRGRVRDCVVRGDCEAVEVVGEELGGGEGELGFVPGLAGRLCAVSRGCCGRHCRGQIEGVVYGKGSASRFRGR